MEVTCLSSGIYFISKVFEGKEVLHAICWYQAVQSWWFSVSICALG